MRYRGFDGGTKKRNIQMSNIRNLILAIALAVLVTGCSAIDKQIKHGTLDVLSSDNYNYRSPTTIITEI